MARRERPYRRLPGRHRRLSGSSTLWAARDHLLLVETGLAHETYRRFYFRDIQTIVLRQTLRYLGWAGGLAMVMLLLTGMAGGQIAGWRRPWLVLLVGAGATLLVHLARGPTCVVHLTTALGTHALSPLRRLRQTRRVLGRIRPLIEEAQGGMPAEELLARAEAIPAPAAFPGPAAPLPAFPPPLLRHGGAWAHAALCGALVLDAVVTSFQLTDTGGGPIDTVGFVVFLAALAAAIVATVRQTRTDLPRGLRRFATSTLVYLLALVLILIVSSMVEAFRMAIAGAEPKMGALAVRLRPLSLAEITLDLFLAIWGLALLLQRHREEDERWTRLQT